MKRYKRILTLVAVLAVFCVATFALTRYEEKQEQIQNTDAVILELETDSVTSLSWEYSGGGKLAFTKTEAGWKYDDDDTFPVSEEKVRQILAHFESFGVKFIIENVEDYSQYGLDDPECTLCLTTDEKSYAIKLGDFSKMDEQRYIDIGDGNAYLVGEDPLDYVDAELSSMIQHDDTPGFETVECVTFEGSENYTITREEESTHTYNREEDLYFVEQNGETVPLDTSKVRKYLNTVTALDLSNYVTYNATEEELATYGMDEPMLSVAIQYTEETENGETVTDTCVIHISENPAERAEADAAEEAGDAVPSVTKYVRVGESSILYTVDDTDFAILKAAGYDDLRHQEIFWADFEDVTQIDLELEGESHTLLYKQVDEEKEDSEYAWFYGETQVQIDEVEAQLLNLTANTFTDEKPKGKEELKLTLHLNQENFEEVEIGLYRYDGDDCLAQVNGKTVARLLRSSVMELVEAVQTIVLNGSHG